MKMFKEDIYIYEDINFKFTSGDLKVLIAKRSVLVHKNWLLLSLLLARKKAVISSTNVKETVMRNNADE